MTNDPFPQFYELQSAAEDERWDDVRYMLTFPIYRNQAALENNYLLQKAVVAREWEVVRDLLTIDLVRGNAAIHDNFVLLAAARDYEWDIVERLLSMSAIMDSITGEEYQNLKSLVEENNKEKVLELLQDIIFQRLPLMLNHFVYAYFDRLAKLQVQENPDEQQKSLFESRLCRALDNLAANLEIRFFALSKILPLLDEIRDAEFFNLHVPLAAKPLVTQHNNTQVVRAMQQKLMSFFGDHFKQIPDRLITGHRVKSCIV